MYAPSITAGFSNAAPTAGGPPTAGGIELFEHERGPIEEILQGDRFYDGGAELRRAVYRNVRRVKPAEANFAEGGHFTGMTEGELSIEFEGQTHPLLDGIRAIYKWQKADYARRCEEMARPIVEPEAVYRQRLWASLPKIERALHIAAHETTPEMEKRETTRDFLKRLAATIARTPDRTEAPAPAGVDF